MIKALYNKYNAKLKNSKILYNFIMNQQSFHLL